MQLNQIENLPWEEVVSKIKTLVVSKKPLAWSGVEQFLQSLHWVPQQSYNTAATTSASVAEDMDGENDDDDILQMVEGVDYYPAEEDEEGQASFPEGEEYDQHYAAFLQNVQDTQAAHNFANDFGKMAVADNRHVVESC